ncbi:DUF1588 domain-containing protein [Nannocystis pusilla]|uniref:DUF1588 domain-containing protein n=1 Tax=Nannocystis pusilla TaxID=889268 RepID=A0ABS7TJX3_9BACT|nr:DUF1588 domain-containing protein [Nannocystis pusilla]MBZ5708514.1 DUF1588 domain-containing protein [Nannocystis pusilla]
MVYLPLGAALFAAGCQDPDAQVDTEGSKTSGAETGTTGSAGDTPTTDGPTSAGSEGTTGEPGDCYSTRDFFADKVWSKGMGTLCVQCHEPTGSAAAKGAKFRLLTPVYPGFIEANLANIESLAGYEFEDTPLILAKPSGVVEHGGGAVLPPESELYKNIQALLEQLEDPIECPPPSADESFPDVVMLDEVQTLRKAALHLVGRLPADDEVAAVEADGEAALVDVLEDMMTEDAFYARLTEILNDTFLTDMYYGGGSLNAINSGNPDWPNVAKYFDKENPMPDDQKQRIYRAVAREPLDLITYIVRNDRPFTEVLTADYTVFTPDSAFLYGVAAEFEDPSDPTELQPGVLKVTRNGKEMTYPHAGVLTSPMWLNRFPTTPTNRNRHRARKVYDQFLATDVLALASQAIDPDAGAAFANPTRDDPTCAQCHITIDPIAGAFQMFDRNNQEFLLEKPVWFPEMFAPGYQFELMPTDLAATGVQWLAQKVVADPRFSLSATYKMYQALTGEEPARYPTNAQAPDYQQQLAAWQTQDAFMRAVAAAFVADNHNLKAIIVKLILSPYYRGVQVANEPSEAHKAELAHVGTGRLSTPELLARKVIATTGVRWGGTGDLLNGEFKLLYGGIDSNNIVQRLSSINQLMASVAQRMAAEVSCNATAFDFSKPADARLLFPLVEPADTPDFKAAEIKANIQYLHERILGEVLASDDPELERTYELYREVWLAGAQNIADDLEGTGLGPCGATKDPNTGVALPDEQKLTQDELYTIRAWQAVVAYLLSDFAFLYE